MVSKTTRSLKVLAFVAIVGVSAGLGRASVTACGSATASDLASVASGINGANASSNTPTQGCSQTDLGFSNFAVNPQAGSGTGNGPAPGSIAATTTGGVLGPGNATVSDIGISFAAAAGFTTGSNTAVAQTINETIGFQATPNLGRPGSNVEPAAPSIWELTGVTALSITGLSVAADSNGGIPTGAGAPSVQITETVCIGQTSSASCVGTNEAILTILETYTGDSTGAIDTFSALNGSSCTGVSSSFGCVASGGSITFNPVTSVFVTEQVVLNHPIAVGTGAYSIAFSSFTDPFQQEADSPEPSTFLLLGAALASLGAIRLRRRKQS